MSNLLHFYGMCGLLKECLLQRYFSKVLYREDCSSVVFPLLFHKLNFLAQLYQEVRGNVEVPESEIVQACRKVSAKLV